MAETPSGRPRTRAVPPLERWRRRAVHRVGGPLRRAVDRRVERGSRGTGEHVEQQIRRLRTELGSAMERQAESLRGDSEERIRRRTEELIGDEAARRRERDRAFSRDLWLGAGIDGIDRTVAADRIATLRREVAALADSPELDVVLTQAYRLLLDHETRGLGRIAGTTYNALGKLTVPLLLEPPDGPVLEIGTLYGLFSPALVRQLHRRGRFRHLTVLDPLAGSQLQPGTTPFTDRSGVPVTSEVARRNLRACGLGEEEFRLVQGFSTDAAARESVGDRRYAVVVVDGDHSEEGVLADLRWVETICLPGAVVVVDDFGDPRWAGVERAVRRHLRGGDRLQLLGSASTSAYLRMPGAEAGGPEVPGAVPDR